MTWSPIDEKAGLWAATYRVPMMVSRSTAVRLSGDGLLVYSPGGGFEAETREALGSAELLLCPNNYHHLGLPAWRAAFPDAVAAASPKAHPRLLKQGRKDLAGLEPVIERLPEHVTLLEVPHTRIGEVWLRVQTDAGVTWVIGDAFFNLKLAKRWRTRAFQRIVKSAPGLAMSQLMKWAGLKDRKAFRQWLLERVEEDAPTRLVPVHGDVLESHALPEMLRAFVARRL